MLGRLLDNVILPTRHWHYCSEGVIYSSYELMSWRVQFKLPTRKCWSGLDKKKKNLSLQSIPTHTVALSCCWCSHFLSLWGNAQFCWRLCGRRTEKQQVWHHYPHIRTWHWFIILLASQKNRLCKTLGCILFECLFELVWLICCFKNNWSILLAEFLWICFYLFMDSVECGPICFSQLCGKSCKKVYICCYVLRVLFFLHFYL